MISLNEVLALHALLISHFGGTPGIRDEQALESAISRPYQSFDNRELYPGPIDKAAAVLESIITNHPFLDGNKRVGYALMLAFLAEHELDFMATQDEKYDFVISVAIGERNFEEIREWIRTHLG